MVQKPSPGVRNCARALFAACLAFALVRGLPAQTPDANTAAKLKDFDAWMARTLKDWNVPGIGVAVVVGDKLVFAEGYGYRDYGQKLPFTPNTLYQIASNSKLFTAVAAGLLVEEGKLTCHPDPRERHPLSLPRDRSAHHLDPSRGPF